MSKAENRTVPKRILFFLAAPALVCVQNFGLLRQLIRREVKSKYLGSYLGILWNLITPLTMLVVYTFVFGVVFRARWENQQTENQAEFALALFAGLLLYNFFSECVNRSAYAIVSNVNYVKKVVFPLEILSVSQIVAALVPLAFSVGITVVGRIFVLGSFDWKIVLLPVLLIPMLFLILGLSWIVSAVSVFVRDMQQTISLLVMILGYLTPVFYPLSMVPEFFRNIMMFNPLTYFVSGGRNLLMYGLLPDPLGYAALFFGCYAFLLLALWFFRRVKGNFADII